MKKLIAIVLLGLLLTSAFAKVDFYGSASLGYWYEMKDEDMTGVENRIDMQLINCSTSRMGINYLHEKYIGKVELGLHNSGNVYTRLIYGKIILNEDGCNLLVGQTYSGFTAANVASQATSVLIGSENLLFGYGAFYDGRKPMIKFTNKLGIYLSISNPSKIDAANLGANNIDTLIPKINLGYNYKNGNLGIYPTFGLNMSKYNKDASGIDDALMAYAFATTIKYNLNKVAIKCQVNYGLNVADYGMVTSTNAGAGWDDVDQEVIDTVTMGGFLQITYPVGCTKITAGGGYVISSNDALTDDDTGMSAFLQGNIKLHKNASLIPEVGIIDDMEDGMGVVEGSEIYFGTKLQMDF